MIWHGPSRQADAEKETFQIDFNKQQFDEHNPWYNATLLERLAT